MEKRDTVGWLIARKITVILELNSPGCAARGERGAVQRRGRGAGGARGGGRGAARAAERTRGRAERRLAAPRGLLRGAAGGPGPRVRGAAASHRAS